MQRLILLLLLLSPTVSPATNLPYTRVLLPVYTENAVPGAYGSLWQTQLAMHNSSQIRYFVETCTIVDSIASPGCLPILYPDEALGPNETHTVLPGRYPKPANGGAGTVLYLLPDLVQGQGDPNDLSFELRIRDTSRSATSAGTEVPVVREAAFRTSTLRLLDIPVNSRFRLALRLFEMNLDQAEFRIRVVHQDTNELVSERHVTTSTPSQGAVRLQPGFAEIRDLTSSEDRTQPSSLRIEVEPLTTGSAFWAYASVTNNDSQQVTLITPQ